MRVSVAVSFIAVAFTLSSCASTGIAGARVYGRALNRVTPADIRAAIDADNRASGGHHMFGDINEVDVVSSDEMHIYHGRRLEGLWPHCVVRRVNGKWQYDGEMLMS
jgi:hypothetical protein